MNIRDDAVVGAFLAGQVYEPLPKRYDDDLTDPPSGAWADELQQTPFLRLGDGEWQAPEWYWRDETRFQIELPDELVTYGSFQAGRQFATVDHVAMEAMAEERGQDPAELRNELQIVLTDAGYHVEFIDAIDGEDFAQIEREAAIKRRGIVNAIVENVDGERIVTPLPMTEIVGSIHQLMGRWPKRVGNALFYHDGPDGICWLPKHEALFGLTGTVTGKPPKFTQSPGCHSRAEVFAELTRVSEEFDAIEEYPHWPPFPTHYYTCGHIAAINNGTLTQLLDFFSPETEYDEDLIFAMVLTLFWGGPPGARPAFVIVADEGRGSGKTKLAELLSSLVGGCVSIEHGEDEAISTRLLSPEGMKRRVALGDNVKTSRFSSAFLEKTITADTISGKRLYVGEGQRPNTITYIMTLNGPAMSEDLAQRSVIIKLAKPQYTANWLEDVRKFIESNRDQIIEDIAYRLTGKRAQLDHYSRWQSWERDVLALVAEPHECQRIIKERQGEVNCDRDEADIIEDYFARMIASAHLDPEVDRVYLPSRLIAEWMGDALHEKTSSVGAGRKIRQMIREGQVNRIAEDNHHGKKRGVIWWPESADSSVPPIGDIECRLSTNSHT